MNHDFFGGFFEKNLACEQIHPLDSNRAPNGSIHELGSYFIFWHRFFRR
jgi:hypothetical protein